MPIFDTNVSLTVGLINIIDYNIYEQKKVQNHKLHVTNHICRASCPKFKSFYTYTGQTKSLRKRVMVHKEQIKHEKDRRLHVSFMQR